MPPIGCNGAGLTATGWTGCLPPMGCNGGKVCAGCLLMAAFKPSNGEVVLVVALSGFSPCNGEVVFVVASSGGVLMTIAGCGIANSEKSSSDRMEIPEVFSFFGSLIIILPFYISHQCFTKLLWSKLFPSVANEMLLIYQAVQGYFLPTYSPQTRRR